MGLFDSVFARIQEALDQRTPLERAAELIETKLRSDATTRRGNVPQFGPGAKGNPGGYVPISATPRGNRIDVSGPDWVMEKAVEKGQVEEWEAIVRAELLRVRR